MLNEQAKLDFCQEKIQYRFRNPDFLKTALSHTSYADTPVESNERMEFLGDAVLGLIIAEDAYRQYPNVLEGTLSVIKGTTVSRRSCARVAHGIELQKALFLGRGLVSIPESILANAIESLIAAVYLDGGLEAARDFIDRFFNQEMNTAAEEIDSANFKSALQTASLRHQYHSCPVYLLLDEKGPDHRKCFKIQVKIDHDYFQAAWGNNKKDAEQKAAENALAALEGEVPPWPDGDH